MGRLEVNEDYTDIVRLTTATSSDFGEVTVPFTQAVSFYKEGELVEMSTPDANGYLDIPANYPIAGESFTIEAELKNGDVLQTNGIAPMAVLASSTSFIRDGTLNEDGEGVRLLSLTIDDPPGIDNYYEIVLLYYTPRFDTTLAGLISYRTLLYNPNLVLTNEDDQEYNPSSMFFSDALFDGESFRFSQYIEGGSQSGTLGTQGDYGLAEEGNYLLFRSLDRVSYDYLKSWTRHRYTQDLGSGFGTLSDITFEQLQDVLFSPEPTPLISNVTGGLGVVGAVHTQVIRIPE